ncbi:MULTISPECIES: hypothetical protein [Microbacterium]|uniref:hypothetical protein n=1 Tax=Microbacterium TaxID=33882 RepID=UPI000D6584B9|nr:MULTISPECIES: hypothetical protein [Microbacterium]
MTTSTDTDRVLLAVESNRGYAPDQITDSMTLRDLLNAVEQAIEEYGEDAMVVTHDGGNRYGANYGAISIYADTFTAVETDEDE